MLEFFDDETECGKLYINYPMVDSYRFTDKLPDEKYCGYEVSLSNCRRFKEILATEKPFYRNEKNLQFNESFREKNIEVLRNWQFINFQNIAKANFICEGENKIPLNKADVAQNSIFNAQLSKYVYTKNSVAILNAFPLFLFEYLKDEKLILPPINFDCCS